MCWWAIKPSRETLPPLQPWKIIRKKVISLQASKRAAVWVGLGQPQEWRSSPMWMGLSKLGPKHPAISTFCPTHHSPEKHNYQVQRDPREQWRCFHPTQHITATWPMPTELWLPHGLELTATLTISHISLCSVQLLGRVQLFATPWTAAHQASLSITNPRSLPKLISIESMMPSNHFILCRPLLLLPSIFPSIRVFSNESALPIRWPKYWSFSFNISPSNEYSRLISFRMDWLISLQSKGLSRVFSNTTVQKHQYFSAQLSL